MAYDPVVTSTADISRTLEALAEPRRRQILTLLAARERSVTELVNQLGVAQPQVSKRLRALREVGLVDVREEGRVRIYRLRAHRLKAVHDWIGAFERHWDHNLARIRVRAEANQSVEPTRDESGITRRKRHQ